MTKFFLELRVQPLGWAGLTRGRVGLGSARETRLERVCILTIWELLGLMGLTLF